MESIDVVVETPCGSRNKYEMDEESRVIRLDRRLPGSFRVSDTSNKGDIVVNQPRIYYGELITDYSIVGAPPTTPPREYDSDTDAITYTGNGGVPIGNLFNRLVFAMSYGERNILFNGSINRDSKILFVRDLRERLNEEA